MAAHVNERVVVDGSYVFAAGVTAGIDGALRLAAELRGDDAAAPEPPPSGWLISPGRCSSTWAMMILGFFGVGFVAYRRKSQGSGLRTA